MGAKILDVIDFEKYPIYKDSGVQWLGDIPDEWEILPAKRFHRVLKTTNNRRQCNNVLSLTLRGVVNNDPDSPEGLVPKDYGTYQIFEKDNLVFKLIDLENVKTSRVGLVHEKGIMSPAYIRLIIGNDISPKFAFYYYYSLYINQVYNNVGEGVRSTIGPNDLLNLPFLKPELKQQIAIVETLDNKIKLINQAIKQKEKQLVLLKEQRQIGVQDVLVKGLNNSIEFKDAGIDFLNKIPKHWKTQKLKFVLGERSEKSKDGLEPLLMVSQVHGLVVRSEYHEKAEVSKTNIGNKKVYKNDLVFNKLKAHLGVFFKSTIEFVGIVSPDYAVYYPIGEIEDLKYLELLFRHPVYIGQFICKATGIVEGLIRLYTSDLFDLKVPIPPKDEQILILSYIDELNIKVSNAIKIKEKEIEKLKEYKDTLINSAVTGKIKVSQ
jgi:type I restriction enzyme S subunit